MDIKVIFLQMSFINSLENLNWAIQRLTMLLLIKVQMQDLQVSNFKNTPDGVFIDKLSGEPLFDTRDRFVSRSGWLSFTKAVDGAVYELPDNSYGMKRTEIRSVSSGIHLGHVFDDGPMVCPDTALMRQFRI